ncbi:hypothetical protein [Facklamia miroungae]|uniref:Virus attachment protein p12 family protein n=1 Tax=Facklamia miroungae TaxID=120956 RepID=A0A1G7QHG3_9LACT|nr:hypothetical protein [Facklamia miroungae]NKZ28941.1 hypothetical protein [Facklamia miroungae]SDF97905.1 hypothetical protein SAMN05421791_10290 [Facklamia miroungae]
MNLQTLIILLIILGLLVYFLVKEWHSLKTGRSKCTSCTVSDCPLAGLNVKSPPNTAKCPCETVADRDKTKILKEVNQAKLK